MKKTAIFIPPILMQVQIVGDTLPHDRKSWNTPWTNPVCLKIHTYA